VAKTESKAVLQNAAIRSIAISQGMKEQEFLTQSLNHPDPIVRAETAKSISEIKDPKADKLVGQYLTQEKTSWVVKKVNAHRNYRAMHQNIVKKKANPAL
jgi:hypothetical protein